MGAPSSPASTAAAGCYDRPIWTIPTLVSALGTMPRYVGRLVPTVVGKPIDNRLREMLMLAVSTENRCWYCQTAHTELGDASGLRQDEIAALLAGRDERATEAERAALRYARDLARRGFASHDEQLREELLAHFNEAAVEAIEATAHVMNFANRFGNTFDAARHRARGGCDESQASVVDLAVVSAIFVPAALCVAPVVGLLRLRRKWRGRSSDCGER